MKQTAVDWLIDALSHKDEAGKICINIHPDCDITYEVKRAKQLEKEQIERAYHQGVVNEVSIYYTPEAEQYYKQTYGDE